MCAYVNYSASGPQLLKIYKTKDRFWKFEKQSNSTICPFPFAVKEIRYPS